MSRSYFLTGTDTEIGKTFVTCALLHRAACDGLSAAGLKPVAAGTNARGENDDVEALRAASTVDLPRDTINPYLFAPAIAPHLAAADAGITIDFGRIAATVHAAQEAAERVIVEGVGGFCVPFAVDRSSADLAVHLGLPVILVVGMRLGCLNHALLSAQAIAARGLTLAGWVANRPTPEMARFDDNLATLRNWLTAPCLGVVPHDPAGSWQRAADTLHLPG